MATREGRRAFLRKVGTVGATGVAAMTPVAAADPQARPAPHSAAAGTSGSTTAGYTVLSLPEAAFVEAAVDRLIPADDLTPSGTDCGVATFIDRQLAGAWGSGDRLYMQGPWAKGTPNQGYQFPMTPAEFFRAGIAATNTYCVETHAKEFDRLSVEQQIQVLQGLERGTIAIYPVPAEDFFNILLNAAMEGFFADPIYGGNREKASWKMLGFPGVIAVYSEHIKNFRNRRYDGEPTSIADLT